MRKLLITTIAALTLASPAAAAGGKAPLVVAMHDPGCHSFLVGGKYTKSVVRHGPVTLVNRDEATLKVRGPSGTKLDRTLGAVTLRAKGIYHITMVGQAPDDNHLTLTIR